MVEGEESAAGAAKRKKWPILAGSVALGLIVAAVALLLVKPWHAQDTSMLPDSVTRNSDFTVYFYPEVIPGGFIIDDPAKDIQSSSGVLLIRLTNEAGQSLVLSQQAVPPSLKDREVQGDEKVTGAPGSAAVSFQEDRTTGTILTKNKTMVVANTVDKIGTDVMKDLLRGLEPVR